MCAWRGKPMTSKKKLWRKVYYRWDDFLPKNMNFWQQFLLHKYPGTIVDERSELVSDWLKTHHTDACGVWLKYRSDSDDAATQSLPVWPCPLCRRTPQTWWRIANPGTKRGNQGSMNVLLFQLLLTSLFSMDLHACTGPSRGLCTIKATRRTKRTRT